MNRTCLVAALLAVAAGPLTACGETSVANDSAAITVPEGDTAARMRAMNDQERNATLYRAIADAGHDCQQVVSSTALPDVEGRPAWDAACQTGPHFTIVLGRDGIASVITPPEVEQARPNPG